MVGFQNSKPPFLSGFRTYPGRVSSWRLRSHHLSGSVSTALYDLPTHENIKTNRERMTYEEPLPTATHPKCFGVVEVTPP